MEMESRQRSNATKAPSPAGSLQSLTSARSILGSTTTPASSAATAAAATGAAAREEGVGGGGRGRRSSSSSAALATVGGSSVNMRRSGNNTSPPSAHPDKQEKKKAAGPVYLVLAVSIWYSVTVAYSVYNTAVLQLFPFPLTVLAAELGAGVLITLPAWVLGVVRTPSLRMSQMPVIFYVSLWHTLSNASTGAALRYSSLAAVTAVQTLEPLASALGERLMSGEKLHRAVYLCILPIIGGVLLVSVEASLTWGGLFFAVASSVSVGIRDLFSKRASNQKEFYKRPLSAANTYAVVTFMSFATVLPYACIVDGPRALRWWAKVGGTAQGNIGVLSEEAFSREDGDEAAAAVTMAGLGSLVSYLGVSGVLLFLHSAAAFQVLEKMGSVTAFSVCNSVKRGVVVLAGAVLMRTPVGLVPALGAFVAVMGTAAYWVAKMSFPPRRNRKSSFRQQ